MNGVGVPLLHRLGHELTKLLDQALRSLKAARRLPPDTQDDIARLVLALAGAEDDAAPLHLTSDECAAIEASQAAAARGEFATDEQIRAAWAKHNL